MTSMSLADIEADFRAAMASHGIETDSPIQADGRIHSFYVIGEKRRSKNGRYALFTDPVPGGWFGTWKNSGMWQTWYAKYDKKLSPAECAAQRAKIKEMHAQRIAEAREIHTANQKRAWRIWGSAKPATNDHPYLLSKGVGAFGLRRLMDSLVIPLRDVYGVIWSLQFVEPDGTKRFLSGGRKRGCYFPVGIPKDTMCICEGYATGASVFMATGHATAIAFDAGNLEPVAQALRQKFPNLTLIIAADNDSCTPGNPGLSKAIEAALAVGGLVAYPSFEESA